jgi:hypothetical protein
MRKVVFKEPDTQEWQTWRQKAQTKTSLQNYTPGGKVEIDKLYQERKEDIVRIFEGKCAYCEAEILYVTKEGDVEQLNQAGDVEHFRPKGRITDEDNKPVRYTEEGKEYDHPGYYWLAYHPRNLLLACATCNRPWTRGGVERLGKWDLFPIRGTRVVFPEQEEKDNPLLLKKKEEPLLLNPTDEDYDPNEHFTFDGETGILGAKTDEARKCIQILGLNRGGLIDRRRILYDAVRMLVNDTLEKSRAGNQARVNRNIQDLNAHIDGKREYSFAALVAIQDEIPNFQIILTVLSRAIQTDEN